MDIKTFQEKVITFFTKFDKLSNYYKHAKLSAYEDFNEEVGEVARKITSEAKRPEKFNFQDHSFGTTHVIQFIIVIANLYNIDLSSKFEESKIKVENRILKLLNLSY